jgi:putative protease
VDWNKANQVHKEKPELLMPAGSLQKLRYAFAYGADAAYLGVPLFSLRARENEFTLEDLHSAREDATRLGKKIYVTANIFSKNRKLKSFEHQLAEWVSIKPDAFIMSDPGLMMKARERFPDINIHLSVQANCMNWQSVKFWHQSLGVSRIILSRELNIDEIKEIKQRVPEVELEAFVHGSICIAYSGRCLMSSYMSYRDANQGVCDNSCREKYKVYTAPQSLRNEDFYLEDRRTPGELYQLSEDENGSYLMNSKDLCLIERLKEIYDAGVTSFKVEGRTKSLNYVCLVAKAYRQAIDDMCANRPFNENLLQDLNKVANRGYHSGFMFSEHPGPNGQDYKTSASRHRGQRFGGIVLESSTDAPQGYVAVEVRNKISRNQNCEVIFPDSEPLPIVVEEILDKNMQPLQEAHGGAGLYYIRAQGLQPRAFGVLSLKGMSDLGVTQ